MGTLVVNWLNLQFYLFILTHSFPIKIGFNNWTSLKQQILIAGKKLFSKKAEKESLTLGLQLS